MYEKREETRKQIQDMCIFDTNDQDKWAETARYILAGENEDTRYGKKLSRFPEIGKISSGKEASIKVIPKEYEQNSSNKNIEKRRDNVNSNRKIEKAKSFAEIVKQIGNKEADRGMVENSIFFNDTRTTFRDDEGNSRPLQV